MSEKEEEAKSGKRWRLSLFDEETEGAARKGSHKQKQRMTNGQQMQNAQAPAAHSTAAGPPRLFGRSENLIASNR
ncbi:hypothetical protein HPP92_006090 [Vanilla planifolia]|uniref:Uncharacterized protein n=1 Tax=Vanilla planifolia TaxID=51239 RepID=A0A835RMX9_VANPL|nr:hypothetical protein HPP92_006405 [Vanilla planifolia]KAG0495096.1 hypothetical protein HPP92_006090 [Vanilla planifolia]